jgi:type II secretory pathway pseudopilin PulG
MGVMRRGSGQRGFVLLDVLVALVIVLLGLAVFLGNLGAAQRIAARQASRAAAIIEQRNADAKDR